MQVPLGHGDFVVALAAAAQALPKHRTTNKPFYHAAKDGLDEIKRMRQIDRLPRGSKDMRERIAKAIEIRAERTSAQNSREAFVHPYQETLKVRRARLMQLQFGKAWARCTYPWTQPDAGGYGCAKIYSEAPPYFTVKKGSRAYV